MKKIILLPALIIAFNVAQSQVSSDCAVPGLLREVYKKDINRLATNRLFEIQSPDRFLVDIPQIHLDTITEGLAAIFNATSIPERDSVFNIYCVHNLNGWPYSDGGYLVSVYTSFPWTEAWQNLNTLTGNPLMDTILTRYHLQIDEFYNWEIGDYALLTTDSLWNNPALLDSIEMVTGVVSAEINGMVGTAGEISYYTIGNTRYYDFKYEWMDCFDGCDAYKTWKFKVNSDCSVEYLGYDSFCYWENFESSCEPMTPVNCNTFTSVEENVVSGLNFFIYPNPFSFQTTLQINYNLSNATLKIYDSLGRVAKEINDIDGRTVVITRDNLECGLYFVHLAEGGKTIATDKLVITQ